MTPDSLPTYFIKHLLKLRTGQPSPRQSRSALHGQPTCGITCPQKHSRRTCITRTMPVAKVSTAVLMLSNMPMCAPSLSIVILCTSNSCGSGSHKSVIRRDTWILGRCPHRGTGITSRNFREISKGAGGYSLTTWEMAYYT